MNKPVPRTFLAPGLPAQSGHKTSCMQESTCTEPSFLCIEVPIRGPCHHKASPAQTHLGKRRRSIGAAWTNGHTPLAPSMRGLAFRRDAPPCRSFCRRFQGPVPFRFALDVVQERAAVRTRSRGKPDTRVSTIPTIRSRSWPSGSTRQYRDENGQGEGDVQHGHRAAWRHGWIRMSPSTRELPHDGSHRRRHVQSACGR